MRTVAHTLIAAIALSLAAIAAHYTPFEATMATGTAEPPPQTRPAA